MKKFPFDGYYFSPQKSYLIKDDEGTWMGVNEKALLLHLVKNGFPRVVEKNESLSVAEKVMLRIQMERNVVYAGPLAGYDAGMHIQGGYKVLVTHPPNYIKAAKGDWPMLKALIEGMFDSTELKQSNYFHIWMKVSDASFTSKKFVPGPVMALAGPGKSGKTLLGSVGTEILGGRSASPYRYMMGNSNFNSEMIGSEVLIIDDQQASKDLRSRRGLGNHIKNMLFGAFQSAHGKKSNAFTLRPFWRMFILINDETENLMVLPPIDESLEDKIVLLKVSLCPMPMLSTTPEEKDLFWTALKAEIPAYLWWLRNEFTLQSDQIDSRTGVVNFKHPELLAKLSEVAPETRLNALISSSIFKDRSTAWTGTAEELMRDLCNGDFKFEATRLLNWPNATGTYLGKLQVALPKRFISFRKGDERLWKILPP